MKKIIGIIIVLVCLFSIYSIAEEECEHEWKLIYESEKWLEMNTIISYEEYKCEICQDIKQEYYEEKCECDHDWIVKEKCLENNTIRIYSVCSKCKFDKDVYIEQDPCNHNWILIDEEIDWYSDSEDISLESQYRKLTKYYICNKCNTRKVESERIETNCDHKNWKYSNSWYEETTGITKTAYECTECGILKNIEKENNCKHNWTEGYRYYNKKENYTYIGMRCSKCKAWHCENGECKEEYIYIKCNHKMGEWKQLEIYYCGEIRYKRSCIKNCGYDEVEYIYGCSHNKQKIKEIDYEYLNNHICLCKENIICSICNKIFETIISEIDHNYYHDVCINCGHETKHTHDYEKVSDSVVWKTREVVTTYKCFCGDHYTERRPYSEYQQEEATSNSKEFVAPITGKPKLWIEFDDPECKTTHNCDCSNIEHEHDWELMYEEEDDNGNVVHIHYECTFSK